MVSDSRKPWLLHPPGAVSKARPCWDELVLCGREVGVFSCPSVLLLSSGGPGVSWSGSLRVGVHRRECPEGAWRPGSPARRKAQCRSALCYRGQAGPAAAAARVRARASPERPQDAGRERPQEAASSGRRVRRRVAMVQP